jgi:hypothetical protein
MMGTTSAEVRDRSSWVALGLALAPIPALAAGIVVMAAVPPIPLPRSVLAANILAALAGIALFLLNARAEGALVRRCLPSFAIFGAGLMAATLVAPDLDGVHRWLFVGPLRMHASALAIPVILAAIGRIARCPESRLQIGFAIGLAAFAQAVHVLQPDAGQASAFALGCLALGGRHTKAVVTKPIAYLSILGAALAWTRRDPLGPVPHVEGIVQLATELDPSVAQAAVVAVLLPAAALGVIVWRRRGTAIVSRAVGGYLVGAAFVPLFGAFPFPILGAGVSPIVGTYLGLILAWQCDVRPRRRSCLKRRKRHEVDAGDSVPVIVELEDDETAGAAHS